MDLYEPVNKKDPNNSIRITARVKVQERGANIMLEFKEMVPAQSQFLTLVHAVMKGKKLDEDQWRQVDWEAIREEAKAQEMTGISYLGIGETIKASMASEVLAKWKKVTIKTAMLQLEHARQVACIVDALNKQGINTILLKGLAIRHVYARPELRTMSDGDLFVKIDDVARVEELLIQMGYKPIEATCMHRAYIHKKHLKIEIHWSLANEEIFPMIHIDDEKLWDRAQTIKINGISTFSLGPTDLLLHLCLHMATHLKVSSFGIRQILDLVLVYQKYSQEIDWGVFSARIKQWKLEMFTQNLFELIEDIFELEMPKVIRENYILTNKQGVTLLLSNMLEGGVRGRRSLNTSLSSTIVTEKKESKQGRKLLGKYTLFFKFIFPKKEELGEQFSYARRNRLYVPIAWIHRLLMGEGQKRYKLKERITFLIEGANCVNRKEKLLDLLELNE